MCNGMVIGQMVVHSDWELTLENFYGEQINTLDLIKK